MAANPKHLRIWFAERPERRTEDRWLCCYQRHVRYTHNGQEQSDCPACKELKEKAGL